MPFAFSVIHYLISIFSVIGRVITLLCIHATPRFSPKKCMALGKVVFRFFLINKFKMQNKMKVFLALTPNRNESVKMFFFFKLN